VLAAVSRSQGNAVIDDIPGPRPPQVGRAVVRPEAAGIRGSDLHHYSGHTAHCRVPGINTSEFRVMSSQPLLPNTARPRHRRSRPGFPAACCENASTSPRARRSAPVTRVPDALRSRESMPIVVPDAPGRAAGRGGGAGIRSAKRLEGPKCDENVF